MHPKKKPGCSRQSTKKYITRGSPPYPANQCCGETFEGNDGNLWVSKPTFRGVCRWVKASKSARKTSKKKATRRSKSRSRKRSTRKSKSNSKKRSVRRRSKSRSSKRKSRRSSRKRTSK